MGYRRDISFSHFLPWTREYISTVQLKNKVTKRVCRRFTRSRDTLAQLYIYQYFMVENCEMDCSFQPPPVFMNTRLLAPFTGQEQSPKDLCHRFSAWIDGFDLGCYE